MSLKALWDVAAADLTDTSQRCVGQCSRLSLGQRPIHHQKRATLRPKHQFMNQKKGTSILLRQLNVVAKYALRHSTNAALPVAELPPVEDLS